MFVGSRHSVSRRNGEAGYFRYNASLEEIDYTFERGLDHNQVEGLVAMEIRSGRRDLFITGPTGTGRVTWPPP